MHRIILYSDMNVFNNQLCQTSYCNYSIIIYYQPIHMLKLQLL